MILLLSDNAGTARKIQKDLGSEGFPVTVMDDVSQALITLNSENDYRLLLVDFEYSRQDVFEICGKVKRHSGLRPIPLIGIIDRANMVDQILAFEMGVDDFIFLPYSSLEIQMKLRSLQRLIELQTEVQKKDAQLENLKNIQRIMVTLNHYINNALTPLYFAVQIMDERPGEDLERIRSIARDTVEFISKVLQSLHKIVHSGKIKVLREGVYKDIMFDIEQELNRLVEKSR